MQHLQAGSDDVTTQHVPMCDNDPQARLSPRTEQREQEQESEEKEEEQQQQQQPPRRRRRRRHNQQMKGQWRDKKTS